METAPPIDQEQQRHHEPPVKKQLLLSFLVFFLLIGATILFVLYGRGYRLGFNQGEPQLAKTGILQISSKPTGSQVYIDGHLTTATNNAVNLTPGKYTIKITKDGYNEWEKDVQINREVVTSIDALLLPKAPALQSISTFGVESASIDPSGTKLALRIASNSAKKNGIYVLDMTNRGFPVLAGQSSSTQIVDDTTDTFSQATISWSPDGKEILASISGKLATPTYYLLQTEKLNTNPQDITATINQTTDLWEKQRADKEKARLASLKSAVQKYAAKEFRILSFSPDETKILYQASSSADMPVFLKPRRIGNNLLYEQRALEANAVYVYNTKEDINTRILEETDTLCSPYMNDCTYEETNCIIPFSWFPDSQHLLYVNDKKISLVEDDGSNMTTIYAGPFSDHYVFPWPDGSKIAILTNLNNPGVSPTLYTISLK